MNEGSRTTGRYRLALLLCLAVIVPFGLWAKAYRGPGAEWLNNSFGGVPYVVAGMLLLAFVRPHLSPVGNAAGELAVTCVLETLQLWHPVWLEAARATFLGRALLGNTFAWSDFIYYVLGAFAGALWLDLLRARLLPRRPVSPFTQGAQPRESHTTP